MRYITITVNQYPKIGYQFFGENWGEPEEGICINMSFHREMSDREALSLAEELVEKNDIPWLTPHRDNWLIDTTQLRIWLQSGNKVEFLDGMDWLSGVARIQPRIERDRRMTFDELREESSVRLYISKEEFTLDQRTKILLSHKSANKPMVRGYFDTLKELGYDPWLDEEDMAAGTELHRGIQRGFKDSCAAVFFITPEFKDERYLRQEVNYAMAEKTDKGDRFAIITLVFTGPSGEKGLVPDPLGSYVYKEPRGDLDALSMIVRALPITLGRPSWKKGR